MDQEIKEDSISSHSMLEESPLKSKSVSKESLSSKSKSKSVSEESLSSKSKQKSVSESLSVSASLKEQYSDYVQGVEDEKWDLNEDDSGSKKEQEETATDISSSRIKVDTDFQFVLDSCKNNTFQDQIKSVSNYLSCKSRIELNQRPNTSAKNSGDDVQLTHFSSEYRNISNSYAVCDSNRKLAHFIFRNNPQKHIKQKPNQTPDKQRIALVQADKLRFNPKYHLNNFLDQGSHETKKEPTLNLDNIHFNRVQLSIDRPQNRAMQCKSVNLQTKEQNNKIYLNNKLDKLIQNPETFTFSDSFTRCQDGHQKEPIKPKYYCDKSKYLANKNTPTNYLEEWDLSGKVSHCSNRFKFSEYKKEDGSPCKSQMTQQHKSAYQQQPFGGQANYKKQYLSDLDDIENGNQFTKINGNKDAYQQTPKMRNQTKYLLQKFHKKPKSQTTSHLINEQNNMKNSFVYIGGSFKLSQEKTSNSEFTLPERRRHNEQSRQIKIESDHQRETKVNSSFQANGRIFKPHPEVLMNQYLILIEQQSKNLYESMNTRKNISQNNIMSIYQNQIMNENNHNNISYHINPIQVFTEPVLQNISRSPSPKKIKQQDSRTKFNYSDCNSLIKGQFEQNMINFSKLITLDTKYERPNSPDIYKKIVSQPLYTPQKYLSSLHLSQERK